MVEATKINAKQGMALIDQLVRLLDTKPFLGECSLQVYIKLADGRTLRFGVTDDDVSKCPNKLWVQIYRDKYW